MEQYNPIKIEKKWRKEWEKENSYQAKDKSKKPKQYILDMYPYPSGEGLHVGHVKGYIATDVTSRFKRMQGYNVLHPMGWDAFGLPAENYAIKTGIPPAQTTEKAIKNFKNQISSLSLSYDWSREIDTHTPQYYKWTQWFFLLLYKNDLAYKKKAKVNWDPVDQTVLANEQVLPDGTAERSGAKVIQKELDQWFFRITEFAGELADDLDKVDWPEYTAKNQRNWIGKSEGAKIEFKIQFSSVNSEQRTENNKKIEVFTTRPDTLFGATYMVLAPEHELIKNNELQITNYEEVKKYIQKATNKTDIERMAEGKIKTGVELKGVKAINPANQEELPIFIADYVLAHYGTGAIMAVPAHDERDFEFAKKFKLPIKPVIVSDKKIDGGIKEIYQGEGIMINSGKFNDMSSAQAGEKIVKFVDGEIKTTYKLRDWLISRQRYWGTPIPIVYDPEGKAHPIPLEHLPWKLPTDVEFKPQGYSPLAQSRELKKRTEKIFGKGWTPEVDTMDVFVCSSWYFFRFADPSNKNEFASKDNLKRWMPVDLYVGGAEHTVLHLLYARFITKALHKLGYIQFNEPFLRLRHVGLVGGPDGRKMGKRYGNVVNPQDIVDSFGADALRVYEMFMGPFDKGIDWQIDGIRGTNRFLGRIWGLAQASEQRTTNKKQKSKNPTLNTYRVRPKSADSRMKEDNLSPSLRHRTIKKVTEDIESMNYNTAISELMKYVNEMYEKRYDEQDLMALILLLAPFAPHIAEELWQRLDKKGSIHEQKWPSYDKKQIKEDTIVIPIQVNGKIKAEIRVAQDISEKELEKLALQNEKVQKVLDGKDPKRVVIVKDRIISIVI